MFVFPMLASIALVTNGVTCSRIQLHRNASDVEVRAAKELRDVIRKMTYTDMNYTISPGTDFIGKPFGGAEILLVTEECGRDLLPKRAVERLAATKNREAFVICSREDRGCGKGICIAGKTPIAVYYGTYAFLEDYLGCGFYHAGPDGTVIPKTKTIKVEGKGGGGDEDIFDFREPWIGYRRMSCWSGSIKPLPILDMFAWQAKRTFQFWNDGTLRNRLSFPEGDLTFAHLSNLPFNGGGEPFTNMVVPDSMFKEHPEYFTLIGGKRVPGKYPARRCYSNPGVKQLFVDYGIRFCDYGGDIAIQITDKQGGWCECEACRQYGTGDDGKWTSSNLGHRFMSEVAAGILAARPNANVTVDAYLQWREIPTLKIRADPRVKCVFAPHQRCYVHALNDPTAECNRHFDDLYNKWCGIYPRNGIFDYYCYAFTEYSPIEYVFAEDMKYYHGRHLEHFVEDTSNGSIVEPYPLNNWPLYYIYSKMLWNPDLDVDKEMDTAYRRYYGKAAVPMLGYHALRRQLWEAAPGHSSMGGKPRQGQCLAPDWAQGRLEAYLKEAAALAKGDKDLESRVERDRKCLEGIWVARWNKIKDSCGRQRIVPVGKVGASRPISVDGALDEKGWTDVPFLSGFRTSAKSLPKAVTAMRAVFDDKGLAFGFEAFADKAKQKGDAVKIVLVSPAGKSYAFTVSADAKRTDDQAVTSLDDRYVAELRVPYAKLGIAGVKTGDDWLVNVARRTADGETSSIDGVSIKEPAKFRRAAFGRNRVADGFFAEAKGSFLKNFGSDHPKLVTNELGQVSVRLEKGAIVYTLQLLDLPVCKTGPTHVRGAITASGSGDITVILPYFTKAPGEKPGEEKRIPGSVRVGKLAVPATPKAIAFEADIPPGAYPSLHIYGQDAKIDGIEITKEN